MTPLAVWQQRVVDEHKARMGELNKLVQFIESDSFDALQHVDQVLLEEQRALMRRFTRVLEARIRRFTGVKQYTCHKQVLARPMTRGAYNELQGWQLPADQDPLDQGYLVEYLDSPNPNHKDFEHYISWSPKDVFDAGYTETTSP